ncbi:hypothetical protein B9J78_04405 [bacterium Unc6]|nr:hypothetical protein [bacterium Unc6]MBT9131249.1 hypothetical protein [Candidatus Psychracetigena formicireducens]
MIITKEQYKQIDKIGAEHNLALVVLHGSHAVGKVVSLEPDVDIAIYRRGGIVFDEYLQLIGKFMEVFGNDIDLKTLHKKPPLFLHLVMRDSILLYGETLFYNQFKAYAYRCYIDAQPLFRLRDHLLRKGIDKLKKECKLI